MAIRQEAVVLGLTGALLGWWLYGDMTSGKPGRISTASKGAPEFVDHLAPDVTLALPADAERDAVLERDLFSPPRDTQPLPRLGLIQPPLEPLPALRPSFPYGPAARHMGKVLGTTVAVTPVPGLFEGVTDAEQGQLESTDWGDEDLALGGGGTDELSAGVSEQLQALGYAAADDDDPDQTAIAQALKNAGQGGAADLSDLDADDPAERIAGYRKLYDSVQMPGLKWGRIRNENRWTLDRRPEEAVIFEEIDPETGEPMFPGTPPFSLERERVDEFAFAETEANRLELRLVSFADPLRLAEVTDAKEFAAECIELRNEVPRALDIAETLCRRALAASNGDDVEAALLLGRIQESNFDLEAAYQTYLGLLETYRTRAEVHVRLADLLARLRVTERAEGHYRDALGVSSTSWLAHWRLGTFLLSQGRGDEGLEYLAEAERREPGTPSQKGARVDIRTDHGRCLLNVGRTEEALEAFGRALNAEPLHSPALAGVVICASYLNNAAAQAKADAAMGALGDELPAADFELSLALGLARTASGDWQSAKRELLAAASLDPFRADYAYAGLSWLAEVTGYPEEAIGYANQAFNVRPNNAWVLFQRGRLLLQSEDLVGAENNLRAALNLELEFADALVGMAEVQRSRAEYLAAERYYERALEADPSRARVHSRRGFNRFDLGEPEAAVESFEEALRLQPTLASAGLGDAWARYAAGDSQEAITRMGELVEARRNEAEGDPFRVWAQAQAERIVDHDEKEVWTDRFERRPGSIGNGWVSAEGFGPTVELREGSVLIDGTLTAKGSSRVLAELPTDTFLAFEADVTVEPGNNGVRAGLFVSREVQGRGNQAQTQALVAIARNVDGTVQGGFVRQGEVEVQWEDLYAGSEDWTPGKAARLTITKQGTGSDTTVSLFLDGVPLLSDSPMSRLGTSTQTLRFGLFAEGDVGRRALVRLDNVRVVRRIR